MLQKISIICVDYNGVDFTRKFCESLSSQDGLGVEFLLECIVVDNSGNDSSFHRMKDVLNAFDFVRVVTSGSNLGYFGGINFGLDAFDVSECNFVVICNNDLEFKADFFSILLRSSYSKSVFAICPSVVTLDGYEQNPHVLKPMGFVRKLKYDLYFSHYVVARFLLYLKSFIPVNKSRIVFNEDFCEIHMGIGAIYVLTKSFFQSNKKLNYPFFLYGEEAFLSEQIHSSGGVLVFDRGLKVQHAESAATSKVPKKVTYTFARESYRKYRRML